MSYQIACTYQASAFGLMFLPIDTDGVPDHCDLRVTFHPLAYYPAERDTGQGADFDADITRIDIYDHQDGTVDTGGERWRPLAGKDLDAAKRFLDKHYRNDMWDEAFAETEAAYYDGFLNRSSAA